MKEYKIITRSSTWSYDSARKKIEKLINKNTINHWQVTCVSFSLGWYGYYAHATLEREIERNGYV